MFTRNLYGRGKLIPFFVLLLGLASVGQTEDLPSLAARATAAKGQFQAITAAQVSQAKAALLATKQLVESQHFSAENELAEKLEWETLTLELREAKPNLADLNGVLSATMTNEPGLELPEFQQFREHLLAYMNLYRFHSSKQTQKLYEQQLDRLAEQLKKYGEQPSRDGALAIGRILGFLESARQAEELVTAVREQFWQPNLYVQMSQRMATSGMRQAVSQGDNINECILGTSITGSAFLTGATGIDFLEHPDRAAMSIVLNGTANSSNVGYNRGVTINSTATTSVFAQKQIQFAPTGITQFRATANAATNSSVNNIQARSRLVRKIAWKRVGQQKGQAQQIASQRAATRIATQFETQSQPMLARTQERYLDRFRRPLLRKDGFPRELATRTSDNHLFVRWLQTSAYDAAATEPPPSKADVSADLFVRLHESMVGNMSQAAIGGVTLTDEKLVKLLEDMEMEVPEELKVREDADPWSITFANSQPITVQFGEDTVRLAIRGRRFTRGDVKVNDEMEIAATYKIETTPKGVRLVRQGDVFAAYVKGGFERAEKITIKTIMRKKFAALFEKELNSDGIAFPGRSKSKNKLYFTGVKTDGRWAAIGWNLDPPAKTAAQAKPNNVATTQTARSA